ncbi:hypothetical protein [Nocardia testacea]|uniref:hypothetical protein n=1 Tax=Nocardia testacea TaxID=248551 RepID=UPI0012F62A7B|nr:hypothetical protein [Nocardia testacea]
MTANRDHDMATGRTALLTAALAPTGAHALLGGPAGVPVSFSSTEPVDVAISPRAMICPQGWAGFIVLQGRAIVTVPSASAAASVRSAVAGLFVEDLVDPGMLGRVLCLEELLGPATPACLDENDFRQAPAGSVSVDRLSAEHPDLRRLEVLAARCPRVLSGCDRYAQRRAVRDGLSDDGPHIDGLESGRVADDRVGDPLGEPR